MAKLNLFVSLNSYADITPSNNPSLNLFKWARDIQALEVDKPQSTQFSLAPGETRTIFDGTRSLLQDGTTQYQLTLKSGTQNTYVLKHVGGTAPQFRVSRTTGADATTQVTVTKNGGVLTFASTAGTPFSLVLGGVQIGDDVKLGQPFSAANQGTFKVLSVTATSFSVENISGTVEGPITLGAGFADAVRIFGASGVQASDKLRISSGFSPASRSTYEITSVQDNAIEFYSTSSLPQETVTTTVTVYSQAKRLVYAESDKKIAATINGSSQGHIEPMVSGTETKNGMMLKSEAMWSMSLTNDSLDTANIFVASVE